MTVAVVKCSSYSEKEVDQALSKSLKLLGGFGGFVKKGQTVLVKPNVLMGKKPEEAATTHPVVLKSVLKELKKIGAKITVGDSPGIGKFDKYIETNGLKQVCKEMKVPIVELTERVDVERKENKLVKLFTISKLANDVDVIINLPKMKTHTLTDFTGAVKNIFGCIPGKLKAQFHLRQQDKFRFSEMLIDLNHVVVPSLHIMDGIVGMEGEGPSSGDPRKVGVLIVGENPYEVDDCACKIIGLKGVPYLDIAKKQKLFSSYDVKGDSVKLEIPFKRAKPYFERIPKFLMALLKGLFTPKPVVDKNKCIHCRKCHDVCPADAIEMVDSCPEFDYKKCIRCYCCHEMCPVKAISLKKTFLLKLFGKS